jgi:hypothetical protein
MYRLYSIVDTVDVLLLELNQLERSGVHFIIHHRYQVTVDSMQCGIGEEIAAVHLVLRNRKILLALPLSLLFFFECLARLRHIPQSATQIAASIRSSPFFRKHGLNSGILSTRKISRSAIKVYVQRLRKALAIAFEAAGTPLSAEQVLVSQETVGNQVLYRLCATVSWIHTKKSA